MKQEIDKLAWVYLKEGKLLVARSKYTATFYVPGGKRELTETDEQALVREIKEEVSVDLLAGSIKYAQTFIAQADGKKADVNVRLTCYFADYKGELKADAEIEEVAFIGVHDKLLCSTATIKLIEWLKEQKLMK